MTSSVAFVARAQLRRRWRAVVFLIVLVGVLGGISISLIAGARRSATVVDRFYDAAIPYDVQVFAPGLSRADLVALPGVERADLDSYVAGRQVHNDGSYGPGVNSIALDFESIDPTVQILDGAVPNDGDPFEVLVNESFVDQFELTTGDEFNMKTFARDQEEEVEVGVYEPKGPLYTFRINGVFRTPYDIALDKVEAPAGANLDANSVALPRQFYEAHHDEFLDFGSAYDIQLADEPGARDRFIDALHEVNGDALVNPQGGRFSERQTTLDTPVDLETTSLLALGIGLAIAGAMALALLLRAEQRVHDPDVPTLRALGISAARLTSIAVVRALPIAIGGAVLAIALGMMLSSRFPVGIGRQLELDRGFDIDPLVVTLGAIAIVVLVVVVGALLGAPRSAPRDRPASSSLADRLARVGAPADVYVGTHLAFGRGQGRRVSAAGPAVVGGAAALVVLIALAMFIGGADRLYDEPDEHGFPWDVAIGNTNFTPSAEEMNAIADDPRLAAATKARYGEALVGGTSVEVLAVDGAGSATPQIVSGRMPSSPSEIALGARLLRHLGLDLGDTVRFSVAGTEFDAGQPTEDLDLTVVGTTIIPVFGEADLGDTAMVMLDAIEDAGGFAEPHIVLARVRGDDTAATVAELDRDYTQEIAIDTTPARIVSLHRVRSLPLLGIALAGALGTAILVYTLALTVHARRKDLSILRSLGLPSRRLGRVLAAQGVALTAAMLAVGVPIGILVGAVYWRRVADALGVSNEIVVTGLLALVVPASLLVAIAASLLPARRARRESVGSLLRAD